MNRTPVIYARLVNEALNARQIASRCDLREDVKERCAKLHIAYDSVTIEEAIEHVERAGHRHDIPKGEPPPARANARTNDAAGPGFNRDEAREWVSRLQGNTGFDIPPEPYVPAADREPMAFARRKLRRGFQADRVKAARIVMAEITESIARCEALEAAVAPVPADEKPE